MKRIIKIFGVLGVFLLGLSTFVSTGTSVYATEKVNTDDLEIKNKLVDELTFYFDTVGFLDEHGVYHIKDFGAIRERISQDNEQGRAARVFYEHIIVPRMEKVDWKRYAGCVAINSLPGGGVAWAIGTQGDFIEALKAFNFEKAADLLLKIAEKQLGKAAAKELAKVNIVAGIAAAAASCALE
ncbi:TPA: peptidase [Enterococcus faecium]|nr:peptidase [Enterococcus faecium]